MRNSGAKIATNSRAGEIMPVVKSGNAKLLATRAAGERERERERERGREISS